MLYSALSWVLLASLPGGSGDDLRRDLAADEETTAVADDTMAGDPVPDSAPVQGSLSYEEMQNPPPQNPPPPPPPPQNPPAPKVEVVEPPCPVNLSLNGRIPFPLGNARFATFTGGTTVTGERVRYDDIFREHGYGGAAELAFMKCDWEKSDLEPRDAEGKAHTPVPAVDRHSSGFYIAGQFDTFQGDTFSIATGQIKVDRLNDQTIFIGFKDHEPWGGRLFSEIRVGGGAIHYSNVQGSFTSGGGSTGINLFRDTWGPAGEVALRIGLNFGRLTIFIGGEGLAAQGPREGRGLPFAIDSNTFFTAAAEAGIVLGF